MGTKFAPTYATLFLGFLEEQLYEETEKHISEDFSNYLQKTWKRYLDDCFIFWIKDTDELNTFINLLNDLHEDINFTMEINNERLPFFDIEFLICKDKCNKQLTYTLRTPIQNNTLILNHVTLNTPKLVFPIT